MSPSGLIGKPATRGSTPSSLHSDSSFHLWAISHPQAASEVSFLIISVASSENSSLNHSSSLLIAKHLSSISHVRGTLKRYGNAILGWNSLIWNTLRYSTLITVDPIASSGIFIPQRQINFPSLIWLILSLEIMLFGILFEVFWCMYSVFFSSKSYLI